MRRVAELDWWKQRESRSQSGNPRDFHQLFLATKVPWGLGSKYRARCMKCERRCEKLRGEVEWALEDFQQHWCE